jgi:hypothetical protein
MEASNMGLKQAVEGELGNRQKRSLRGFSDHPFLVVVNQSDVQT